MSYTADDVDRVINANHLDTYEGWYEWKWGGKGKRRETELGLIEYVDSFGGEGEGDQYWVVISITDDAGVVRHWKRHGWYQSYCGGELDGPTEEVKPVERVVTFYE